MTAHTMALSTQLQAHRPTEWFVSCGCGWFDQVRNVPTPFFSKELASKAFSIHVLLDVGSDQFNELVGVQTKVFCDAHDNDCPCGEFSTADESARWEAGWSWSYTDDWLCPRHTAVIQAREALAEAEIEAERWQKVVEARDADEHARLIREGYGDE